MAAYYFLISLLPPLPGVLGEKLAAPFSDLARMVRRHINPEDDRLLRAQLSLIDAANWESIDQGMGGFVGGGITTREEMETGQNLPEFIRIFREEKERGIRRLHVYDRLWELCYAALLTQAEEEGCRFLIDYIVWEMELRNRLVVLRLRESEKSAADYSIMPGLRSFDFTALVSQLEGQRNPLEAERFLDSERLKRIYHCRGADPFSINAVLAYLAGAFIYSRWEALQIPVDIEKFIYSGG